MVCVNCECEFKSDANCCTSCSTAKSSEHDTNVLIPTASPCVQPQKAQTFTPMNNIHNRTEFRRMLLLCIVTNLITIILITLQLDFFFWNSESHEVPDVIRRYVLELLPFFRGIARIACLIFGINVLILKKRLRYKSTEAMLASTFSIIPLGLIIIDFIVSIFITIILIIFMATIILALLHYDSLLNFRNQFSVWANKAAYLSHVCAFSFGLLVYLRIRERHVISSD